MNHEVDWVADVRRWVLSNPGPKTAPAGSPSDPFGSELGCEAAHPALESRGWAPRKAPDGAPRHSRFSDLA